VSAGGEPFDFRSPHRRAGEAALRSRFGIVLLLLLPTVACESAQTRSELARQAKALDAVQRAVGDARHYREEHDLVERQIDHLEHSVTSLDATLERMRNDLEMLGVERAQDVEHGAVVDKQIAMLRQRIDVLEAGQRDITAGLQSLVRNREDIQRLEEHLRALEDKVAAALERPATK
jgi:chromosome segregation ATPase